MVKTFQPIKDLICKDFNECWTCEVFDERWTRIIDSNNPWYEQPYKEIINFYITVVISSLNSMWFDNYLYIDGNNNLNINFWRCIEKHRD